uniref:Uncharacterized protein n=1 Tax=Panagrolaimus davidi TaxID=227884 RepID=A0A914NZ16_9BILA
MVRLVIVICAIFAFVLFSSEATTLQPDSSHASPTAPSLLSDGGCSTEKVKSCGYDVAVRVKKLCGTTNPTPLTITTCPTEVFCCKTEGCSDCDIQACLCPKA